MIERSRSIRAGEIVILISISFFSGCERNNLEVELNDCAREINYFTTLAPLFETRCAISGCHVYQSPTGDFNRYEEIKIRVDNGKFKLLVLDLKSMPPDGGLSEEELRKIECWMEQGAKK